MVCEARVVFALSFVIMDLYLEQFLSPSSWTDLNTRDRSSWILNEPCQTNGLFPNSIGMYEGNREEPILGMTRSCNALECLTSQNNRPFIDKGPVSHIGMANTLECLTSQNNKPFLNKGPISHISKSTLMDEAQLQQGSQYIGDDAFLNELLSIGSNVEYMGLQLNAATSDPNSLDYHFPEGPPGAVGLDKSPHFHMPTDTGYGGSESYDYQNILGDQVLSAFPNLQRPVSIDDVFSSPFGQERLKRIGFQGECVGSEHLMWNKYAGEDTIMQLDNLYEPVSSKENEMLQNHSLSTFPGGPQITMPSVELQSLPQLVELSEGSLSERPKNLMCDPQPENALVPSSRCCNGNGKPRVRARRGQATDPHSIAERLRREKIAERMRSLQELLPNSNKTDKASMLDEIIEYVKFLQLQIKVLSTRKLAAAGEAVPPMEDCLAQDSINLLPPPSSVQGTNTSRSPDQLVLEKEITELMESNFRMAVQYLETKGLCLMPIALVTAITNEKKVSDPPVSEGQKNHVSGSTLLNGETKKMNLAKEQ